MRLEDKIMNMYHKHAWWVGLKDEDDKIWYRYHKSYKQTTIDWIIDQNECCYQTHSWDDEDAGEDIEQPDPMEILGPLLKHISELDQNILMLRYGHNLKWREIGDKLGYNISYLWKREKRAMKLLRSLL